MTKVRFTFVDIQGNPLPLMQFKLLVRRASFNDADVGVTLPEEISVTTDETGKVIVELWPLQTAYRIQIAEEYEECCGKLNWSFYVPKTTEIVEAQSLFLVPPPNNIPWDEEAIGKITQAVIDTHDNAVAADASADRAEAAAVTIEGDADRAEAAAAAADASKNAAAVSAQASAGSATASGQSAADALASKNAAATSANAANNSAVSASGDAGRAAASATAAAGSATTATNSKDAAAASAAAALASKNSAETAAGTATTKAAEAVTSASNASGSASTANTKAGEAAASATAAKTSETNAKTSETNAATSASNASAAGAAAGTAAANTVVANKQDKNGNLTALSALSGSADRMFYFTSGNAMAVNVLTAKARAVLACSDNAAIRSEIGLPLITVADDTTAGRVLTVGYMGLGSNCVILSGNANNVRTTGFFYIVDQGGGPSGTTYGFLWHTSITATDGHQRFVSITTGVEYTRYLASNVWSAWVQVVKAGDFGMFSQVGTRLPGDNAQQALANGRYYTTSQWAGSPFPGLNGLNQGILDVATWADTNYTRQVWTSIDPVYTAPRSRNSVNGVWGSWVIDVTIDTAARDPEALTGGLIYTTVISGYTVFKFSNGLLMLTGQAGETGVMPANTANTATITLPSVGFISVNFIQPSAMITPYGVYDLVGAPQCIMTSLTALRLTVTTGPTSQNAARAVTVWGRWK